MKNGTRIRVIEQNGRTGTIMGKSTFMDGVYLVKLDGSAQIISFHSDNIEVFA